MTRAHLAIVVLGLAGAGLTAGAARSEPLRTALVISNARYAGMPALTRCTASAAVVRDALRGKGFEVVERNDLGRGEFDAAIGALARRAAASPPTFAALYYCGYALEFNGRSFLLPVSASIARDNDVLTQGIISKSVVDSLARAGETSGFVLLDAFRPPGSAASGMARLAEQIQPSRLAVIGASNDGTAEGLTAASQALRDQVAGERVSLERFVNGIRDQLAKEAAGAAYVVAATGKPSFLAGAPREEPPAPQPAAPQPAAAAVQPPQPSEPRVVAPPPPPPPSAPAPRTVILADDDRMADQDRRQVQVALASMGYYSGRIDAVFGPETRAAIRRYQFEIKAELTGYLTAEQATKLVNSVR
jgi:Putative peptidoglycan binding domain/Caspase domain